MKKTLSLILVIALCLSLCACGKNVNEQLEIVGVWQYDTGSTLWTFIFKADGTCTYYSSTVASSYTDDYYYLVTDENGVVRVVIEGLPNWDFQCKTKFGKMVLYANGWKFKKS